MMTCLSSAFNVDDVDIEEAIAEVAAVVGERPQLVTTRAGQPWVGLPTLTLTASAVILRARRFLTRSLRGRVLPGYSSPDTRADTARAARGLDLAADDPLRATAA